jgi:hypothetical protein
LLLTSYSASINAQVDPTTGNLVNWSTSPTDTTSTWNNGVYVNTICFQRGQAGNCGPNPSVRADSGNINFSYGTTDLNQVVNINRALAAGGSGVQLSGFNFGFRAKNGNGWDDGRQDYLDAYVKFYNATGGLATTYDYASQTNNKYNWTQFNFSETFANPTAASNYSNARFGFIGRDNNYWAGNYGPEITNVSFSLKYRVDPCSNNPAYSPTCAGFNNVVTSGNLLNPNLMSNGNIVYNSFAINTALKSSGAGVDVYGFKYGYNYSLGDITTAGNSTAEVRVRLTDINNNVIYTDGQFRNTPRTAENVSYQFLLPSTTNSLSLGTFTMGANTSGNAAIQNMFANALYKPDPCVDPLYSPSCPGYATAYAKNLVLGSTVAAASTPAPAQVAPAPTQAAPASASPDPTTSPVQQAPTPVQQTPTPTQDPNQNPAVAQDNPAQPSTQQAGPAPTSPQPAGGPPQTATASAPPPSAGPSQPGPSGGGSGPSKLAMSVLKTVQANDKATQATAVQQATKAFESSQQSSQSASNLAISMNQDMSANSAVSAAVFSNQTTQASIQAMVQTSQPQFNNQNTQNQSQVSKQLIQTVQQSQTSVQQTFDSSAIATITLKSPTTVTVETQQQQASSGTGLTINRNIFVYNSPALTTISNTSLVPLQTTTFYQPQQLQERNMEFETPPMQLASFSGLGRAGNPLSEMMMQQRFELVQSSIETQSSTVNKNVQPNELAGGVDLASMAVQPKGFEAYSFVLRDAAFYEPKEVYKGQTVVDNIRALRQMSSDSLHKQMVDMQYKLGE